MKKMISFLTALLLLGSLSLTAFASEAPFVSDGAGLLTSSELSDLESRLSQVSSDYNAQVAVVTLSDSTEGIDDAVEHIYDNGGYGYGEGFDGVLLLVCMDTREYRILSNGFAADAISPSDIDSISDAIVPDLSAGYYADAFSVFADECAYYLNVHINGVPYEPLGILIIAVPIGLVVGLIYVLILKGQLKSVKRQGAANAYVREGGIHLTQSGDYFMYRNVTRTPKPKDSSSSSRSVSSSRNVGGGRF